MRYSAAIPARNVARPSPTNALSLSSLLGGVRAQAARANARPDRASGDGHAAHLQVGQEPPVDPVLGVTDVMSVQRLFAANRAMLGHDAPFVGDLTQKDEKPATSSARPNCTMGYSWPRRHTRRSANRGNGVAWRSFHQQWPPSPDTPRWAATASRAWQHEDCVTESPSCFAARVLIGAWRSSR